jgi:cytochrome P450
VPSFDIQNTLIAQRNYQSRDFETDFTWVMLQVLPTIIARKAFYGRAAVNEAFQKYYADGLEKNASELIRGRAEAGRKYGLTERDMADFEIAVLFTATTNTIPSSFWFLSYIVSSPSLVAEIRSEVSQIVTRKRVDGTDTLEMDITGFQKKCPLLCSAWEETLRLVDSASSARMVVQDTMLADKYLLKAGSVVQMPSGVTHNSPDIWGDDAATFNPRRFIRPDGKRDLAAREKRKMQTQGYFPFGGGKHLCPGRHFAFTEVMGFVATLVYGFEISMGNGSGTLKMPKLAKQKMGTGVRKPATDMDVLIKRRKEFEGVKWTYFVGGEVDFKALSTGAHGEYEE